MEDMTAWFKRKEKGIQTSTEEKKDTPKGLWYKSPTGKIVESEELAKNFYVSPEDDYHVRIGSKEYFEILFDDNKFTELDAKLSSKDPLKFEDTKKYSERLKAAQKKTGLKDAVRTGYGKSLGKNIVICCMDFAFIGGSMGSVVGEKIARGIDYAIKKKVPFVMISKSGGARMMEAALSLMQLAKTSVKLAQLADAGLPLHFFVYRPNHRRHHRFICHVGRYQYCRTRCIDRFCRSTNCKGHYRKRIARRFPIF